MQDFEKTVVIAAPVQSNAAIRKPLKASVVIAKGPKQGESIALNKPYTKLGSASQVAVIARRGNSYYLMPMSGGGQGDSPKLNGQQIGAESMVLKNGDIIEVAATQLKFVMDE